MNDWQINDLKINDEEKIVETDREKRNSICKTCDRLTIIKVCRECSCFMPLKTYFKFSKCPLNKW